MIMNSEFQWDGIHGTKIWKGYKVYAMKGDDSSGLQEFGDEIEIRYGAIVW